MRWALPGLLALSASVAAAADALRESSRSVSAFGRTIDLAAYLELAPAELFFIDQRGGRVYLARPAGQARHVAELPLQAARDGTPRDIGAARTLSKIDISKRNFWGAGYSALLDRTIILTDEAGEERTNLYAIEPEGQFRRLTDVGYVYGWSISPDGRWLAYASRENVEFSPGTIRLLDLRSRAERVLLNDSRALRPYWSTPVWRADSGAFLLTMVLEEDRGLQNVVLVTTSGGEAGQPRVVTDGSVRRELTLPRNAWLDDRRFIYVSTESGEHELHLQELAGRSIRLTSRERAAGSLAGAILIRKNGKPFAVTVVSDAALDTLQVLELPSGRIIFERTMPEHVSIESALADRAILKTTSQTNPVRILELSAAREGFTLAPVAEYANAGEELVQCVPEKVSFRTFDGLSAPGESGTLHAWFYRPKKPLPANRATLIVEAFYGGTKTFSSIYPLPPAQLFCAAGIHFLSPAPRGSWEFGKTFRHLIRGDLGGAEILDVIAAAKWGQRTLDIPAERIGAFGLSHGGYATMRLLTLPETINGQRTDFRFGFGISDAGISNLMRHANNSNIRGWSLDLMGNAPEKDAAKWLDRSPESGAARITGPLLLLHGTNDHRVRIIESRSMAQKVRALGKPVKLVELPGAAHGTAPVPQLYEYWRAVFEFLEETVPAR
ncbi:MAG: S9 family peptidase [Steroidobacteraceae bacterium]